MRRALLLTLLCLLGPPPRAAAQIAMPEGVFLSPFPVLQSPAVHPTFPDGQGGVWSVFLGAQPGSALYANHVHADGSYAPNFNAQAKALTSPATQVNGVSAAWDRLDGALISWFGVSPADSTSPFVALRFIHLHGDGTAPVLFRDTGIVVSTIASEAMIVGDGLGGAYVVWEELAGASNPEIYAQHYDYWGERLWTPSGSPTGRPVCAVVGIQRLRALHSDNAGGAYVVWTDQRSGTTTPLYVAHLSDAGVDGAPWTANGIRVTPITSGIRMVGSGTSPDGGLWLVWRDLGVPNQLLGQHIAANGAFRWTPTGSLIASESPLRADLVPADGGHLLVTWSVNEVRSARMDSSGVRVWFNETAGRVVSAPPGGAFSCRAASDGAGGQWVAWSEGAAGQRDVRVLHVDGACAPHPGQAPGGDVFADSPADEEPLAWFVPTGGAEPLLEWLDAGVVRVRQLPSASLGVEPGWRSGELSLAAPAPHPLRAGPADIRFSAPPGPGRLEAFDLVGRRVAARDLWSAGGAQRLDLPEAASLAPGVYTLRLTVGSRAVTRRVVRLE